ncbi:FAD-binding oxidoreductase [Cytobacillus oceanisediminis]|uniref:FAD-binding oxidoreductase n=1 Tax=Cytobacillus oceanisediminis TaxID=665099 RepID=UPI0030D414D5
MYPNNLIPIVSPGVITADIHKEAEKHGLMYPPDPSSSSVCTIGGNLAENSGGSPAERERLERKINRQD